MLALWVVMVGGAGASPDEAWCSMCDWQTKTCAQCEFSYLDQTSGRCVAPWTEVAGCLSYDPVSPHKCSSCRNGYYLTALKICRKCLVGSCLQCDGQTNKCLACKGGRRGGATDCSTGPACPDPQCEACRRDSGVCLLCKNGFAFDSNNICKPSRANCKVLNERVKDACEECREGYFITSHFTCETPPTNWGAVALSVICAAALIALAIWGVNKRRQGFDSSSRVSDYSVAPL